MGICFLFTVFFFLFFFQNSMTAGDADGEIGLGSGRVSYGRKRRVKQFSQTGREGRQMEIR